MDLDAIGLLILISVMLVLGGVMLHWEIHRRKRNRQVLASADAEYERRRSCEICTRTYDHWTSDAPELYREVFCSDSCYRVFSMMDQFERELRMR
jgi:hypothetical protein